MVSFLKKLARDRKGQGLVEYAILICGVALVGVLAVSFLGHKAGDMIGTVAAILPGSQGEDNATVDVGYLIETDSTTNAGTLTLDATTITANDNGTTDRLGQNVGYDTPGSSAGLIIDPPGDN